MEKSINYKEVCSTFYFLSRVFPRVGRPPHREKIKIETLFETGFQKAEHVENCLCVLCEREEKIR